MTPAPELCRVYAVPTPRAMRTWGAGLAGLLRAGDLVLLDGPLGAGKTTLVQGLGEGLGVRGPLTSPTFVIARVHPSRVGGPALVHVDAYRLHDADELADLDLDASLEDAVTVVEWGAGLARALAADRLEVTLRRAEQDPPHDHDHDGIADEMRLVTARGVGPRWALPG